MFRIIKNFFITIVVQIYPQALKLKRNCIIGSTFGMTMITNSRPKLKSFPNYRQDTQQRKVMLESQDLFYIQNQYCFLHRPKVPKGGEDFHYDCWPKGKVFKMNFDNCSFTEKRSLLHAHETLFILIKLKILGETKVKKFEKKID